MAHQVQVMRDHHDAIARRDTADCDEADERCNADIVDAPPCHRQRSREG